MLFSSFLSQSREAIVLCFDIEINSNFLGVFLIIQNKQILNCRLKIESTKPKKCLIQNSDIYVSLNTNQQVSDFIFLRQLDLNRQI